MMIFLIAATHISTLNELLLLLYLHHLNTLAQWSVFVPKKWYEQSVEFMMQHRGNLDVFVHPNSGIGVYIYVLYMHAYINTYIISHRIRVECMYVCMYVRFVYRLQHD